MTRIWFMVSASILVSGCADSAKPEDAQLEGSMYDLREYVLSDSVYYQLPELCVILADPPNPNSTSLGSASLQFANPVVREAQLRLEHFACSGGSNGDTVYIDQEREYRVEGSRVRIRRPRTDGGWYEDTGHVHLDTLDMIVHQCADVPCAAVLWRYVRRP
jgi:hypothetical protein